MVYFQYNLLSKNKQNKSSQHLLTPTNYQQHKITFIRQEHMCKFAGFICFLVVGLAGGYGIGLPPKLILAVAILDIIFVFLLFMFRWIAGWAQSRQWMRCYISKINIPCVFGFLRDNQYDSWTVQVTTTYGSGRREVHYEDRNNACITYIVDFIIGFLIAFACPALLFYLLVWYVYCFSSSLSIYLEERKLQQEIDVQTAKVPNTMNATAEIIVQPNMNTSL